MHAQDVKAQLKKPQRQKLPWMKDDEDTSAASGDLGGLLTAAAPAAVAAVAVAAVAVAAAAAAAATAAAATEAAATSASATAAAVLAMLETETEPAEAAKDVQARSLPWPSLRTNDPHAHAHAHAHATCNMHMHMHMHMHMQHATCNMQHAHTQ